MAPLGKRELHEACQRFVHEHPGCDARDVAWSTLRSHSETSMRRIRIVLSHLRADGSVVRKRNGRSFSYWPPDPANAEAYP